MRLPTFEYPRFSDEASSQEQNGISPTQAKNACKNSPPLSSSVHPRVPTWSKKLNNRRPQPPLEHNYSPKDKSVVESYFKRQVPQPNNKVIQRLRRDLWKIEAAQKKRRQAAKQYYEEIEEKKRVQKLKENMQQTMAH